MSNNKNNKASKSSKKEGKTFQGRSNGVSGNKRDDTQLNFGRRESGDCNGYRHGDNDVSWYARVPQLLSDVATLAYGRAIGTGFSRSSAASSITMRTEASPGLLAIHYVPGPGRADSSVDAVNTAARNIYSFVRHANSGHANYDAPDLMLYLLAMDSAYNFYTWMQRVYGCISNYKMSNRYTPRVLVEANGVDFDDITVNIADFRSYINNFARKIGSLAVPGDMPLFARHAFMNQFVYVDETSNKAQMYMYVPDGWYYYDEKHEEGGRLTFLQIPGYPNCTLDHIKAFGDQLVDRILGSEDCNIMSGDILKAFGADKLMKIALVSEDYTVEPVYNTEVLSQIENCMPVGAISNSQIVQDPETGVLTWNPTVLAGAGAFIDPIINMHWDSPTAGDTMVATRLMVQLMPVDSISGDYVDADVYTCGTEIVTYCELYTYDPAQTTGDWTLFRERFDRTEYVQIFNRTPEGQSDIEATFMELRRRFQYLSFNHHPEVLFFNHANDDIGYYYLGSNINLDNFQVIHGDSLKSMNDIAVMSEFDVPSMGSWSQKLV